MNLMMYENKRIQLTDDQGMLWEGVVTDYIYPEDNDLGLESIIIKCESGKFPGAFIEFTGPEIKRIKVLP